MPALRIPIDSYEALGFDLSAAIDDYRAALDAHATTVDEPAPAVHALVERVTKEHDGAYLIVPVAVPLPHRQRASDQRQAAIEQRVADFRASAEAELAGGRDRATTEKRRKHAAMQRLIADQQAAMRAFSQKLRDDAAAHAKAGTEPPPTPPGEMTFIGLPDDPDDPTTP